MFSSFSIHNHHCKLSLSQKEMHLNGMTRKQVSKTCWCMQYQGDACRTMIMHAVPWWFLQYHGVSCITMAMHAVPWWCMQYNGGACMQYHAAHVAVTCSRTKWEKKEGREDLKRELGKRSVIEIFPYIEMKSMAQPHPSIPPFHKTESILDTQHYQKQINLYSSFS